MTFFSIVTSISRPVYGQERTAVKSKDTGQPLYTPPSCIGKPLNRMSRTEMMAQTILVVKPNPPIIPENQLRLFNALAKIINDNYLYPDFRGLDWPGIESEFRSKITRGLGTEEFYAELKLFISRLGDNHSSYESPVIAKAVKEKLAGQNKFVGVGALFQALKDTKEVSVLAVIPGSPAEHCGLKQHDIVMEVDSIPLVQNDTVYPLTRGPECTVATLKVRSPGEEPRNIEVIRARVAGAMPVYARMVPNTGNRRIGYIFLPTFFDLTVPVQVKKALEEMGQLDGLILDNRMNGGGASQVLIPMLGYFTSGILGHFVSRTDRRPLEITATPVNNSQGVPLVILISKNTVSYGEVFTGVLQDIGRAKVVGQATAGLVETLRGYHFADSSKAWIAVERFDPVISHANWQGQGVKPDIEAHTRWDQFTFESDPALAVALKLFAAKPNGPTR